MLPGTVETGIFNLVGDINLLAQFFEPGFIFINLKIILWFNFREAYMFSPTEKSLQSEAWWELVGQPFQPEFEFACPNYIWSSSYTTTEKALYSQKKEENIPSSQIKLQKIPSSPLEPENEARILLKENRKQTESQQTGKKLINSVVSLNKRNSEALGGEKSTLENLSPSQKQQTWTRW